MFKTFYAPTNRDKLSELIMAIVRPETLAAVQAAVAEQEASLLAVSQGAG